MLRGYHINPPIVGAGHVVYSETGPCFTMLDLSGWTSPHYGRNSRHAFPGRDRPLKIALLGYRSNPFSGGQGVYLTSVQGLGESGTHVM